MAAGLGFKTFTTGEVLTAADTNGYLMQGILVFASAAARDAAITSPQEGQFAYLKDTNVTTYYTGSAWANVDTTGMTNPMTTTGDSIYSSSGSTPARLGIGSTGQVLTVAAGLPSWATPASGGRTLLSTTTLSGATTTISSISQAYEELYIEIANVNPASNSNLRIAPNSVTNLGYNIAMSGGGTSASEQTYWKINQVWSMTAANTNNITTMYIHNYASSTEYKTAESNCLFQALSQTGLRPIYTAHGFESTTAISSLQFSQDSGNQNGGTVRIYGVN